MNEAMQILGRVLSMVGDKAGSDLTTAISTLTQFVGDVPTEGTENRSIPWDEVSEALNLLAEQRSLFPEEMLEHIDAVLMANRDDLGYGASSEADRAKAKAKDYPKPGTKPGDPGYEEPGDNPKDKAGAEENPDSEDYHGKDMKDAHGKMMKDKKTKSRSTVMSVSDLRNKIKSQGRALLSSGDSETARIFGQALSQLKAISDVALFVESADDMAGLEELGRFYSIESLPRPVADFVRVKEPVSSEGTSDITVDLPVNDRSTERIRVVEDFATGVINIIADSELSRSAKTSGIQALLDGFVGTIPDIIARSTPATERDVLETVQEMLPGAIENALKQMGLTRASDPQDPIKSLNTRRSLEPLPKQWTPTNSGMGGANARQIAELTTRFRDE